MHKLILTITLVSLLTACSMNDVLVNPKIVTVSNGNEAEMNCQELEKEREIANFYKINAKAQDRFKPSYVFVVPAFIAMHKINKAESNAYQRIVYLDELLEMKGCERQIR